ncbi:MAG TPA: response regulator [Holophaga sp.]|nr:response regulator [Holophaga sp.]
MRILLAEDNPHGGNRNRLQLLLEMIGHTVERVTSGTEAFAQFEAEPFPVVIADLAFPDLDGFELCRRIRARQKAEYVYIIILVPPDTGFRFREAESADVDDVLLLPVEPDILRARLRVAERMLRLYEELDRLRGLIPICAYCKKIRQEQGLWEQMEAYITEHSHALFTHTICPECAKREFGSISRSGPRAGNLDARS